MVSMLKRSGGWDRVDLEGIPSYIGLKNGEEAYLRNADQDGAFYASLYAEYKAIKRGLFIEIHRRPYGADRWQYDGDIFTR